MKVNLTRLMESTTRVRWINQEDKESAAPPFIVKTNFETTSSDRAYSFELENEQFSLES